MGALKSHGFVETGSLKNDLLNGNRWTLVYVLLVISERFELWRAAFELKLQIDYSGLFQCDDICHVTRFRFDQSSFFKNF